VTGHVLHLPQIHCLEPPCYCALSYLHGAGDTLVYLLHIPEQVQKAVLYVLTAIDTYK
jgi:hypothetical protein